MRIISGQWGGRQLNVSRLPKYVRPTSNYAKEGLFNTLRHRYEITDKQVLELFAGTGNVGFEFLSLGAQSVWMVEQSAKVCTMIRNLTEVLSIKSEYIRIYQQEAIHFLKNMHKVQFDFIFADPPFNNLYNQEMLDIIDKNKLITPKGIVIYETSSRQTDQVMSVNAPWNLVRKLTYGDTSFYIYAFL